MPKSETHQLHTERANNEDSDTGNVFHYFVTVESDIRERPSSQYFGELHGGKGGLC